MKQMSERQLHKRIDSFLRDKYQKYPELLDEEDMGSIAVRTDSLTEAFNHKVRLSERLFGRHLRPHQPF